MYLTWEAEKIFSTTLLVIENNNIKHYNKKNACLAVD